MVMEGGFFSQLGASDRRIELNGRHIHGAGADKALEIGTGAFN